MTLKKIIILIGLIYSTALNLSAMNNGGSNIPKKFKQLKKQLNSEFMKKANISGLVSYIYYPYSRGNVGHSELEVEDSIWSFKCGPGSKAFLSRRIFKIKHNEKDGLPFYRYVITVTPEQLKKLRENIGKKSFYTFICSLEALSEFSKNVDFNVPFLFRLSPLVSYCYLSASKALGSKRIKNIEFYGEDDSSRSRLIARGMCSECFVIVFVIWGAFVVNLIVIALVTDALFDDAKLI